MKKVYNYWVPDTDNHFEKQINKRIKRGGPAEYQDLVREAAYNYVTDYNICVDVGANVGLFSVPFSKKFKKVIAFEPVDIIFGCLEKNTTGLNVEVNKFALGNTNNTASIVYDQDNTGMSYIDNSTIGTGTITIKRMDDLDLPKFGLLKLDCERYELEVLKGGIETILKYKPIIICEQHSDTGNSAGMFLESHGARKLANVKKDYIFGW